MTIGIVQDYGYGIHFSNAQNKKMFNVEVVTRDELNVNKVAAGRIDAAIIDLNNLHWLLKNDLKNLKDKISVSSKSLENKELLLFFNPQNTTKIAVLKKGLSKVNSQKIVDDHLNKYDR